jgi:hypothetical protein
LNSKCQSYNPTCRAFDIVVQSPPIPLHTNTRQIGIVRDTTMANIVFTTRFTEADWDDTLRGWRCSALVVPGAIIKALPDYALSSVTKRLIGDPEVHFVS